MINMKRIYSFTLDSDDYASRKFSSNLRLLAYLLYDSIYNYDGENFTALNINENIVYNGISENVIYNNISNSYEDVYNLDSDLDDDVHINYEPFILGEKTFCITIDDEVMKEETIRELLELQLRMTNLSYKVRINSKEYYSKNKEDEKNRNKAINILCNKIGCYSARRNLIDSLFAENYNKKRNAILVRKY